MKELFISFTIMLICLTSLMGQINDSVAPTPPVKIIFEKIYIHTDKNQYTVGDTLWFQSYLLNSQNNKLSNSSNTLYVELLALDPIKLVQKRVIHLVKGLGNGQIELSENLSPGRYLIRAYTNWMHNFKDNFIFMKTFNVFSGNDNFNNTSNTNDVKNNQISLQKPYTDELFTDDKSIDNVLFFPEGGALIDGVSSLIAIRTIDKYGKGRSATGTIFSSAGEEVASFTSDSIGFGKFYLLPIGNLKYEAKVNGKSYSLGNTLIKGLALRINQTDSSLIASISKTSNTSSNQFKLIIRCTGRTFLIHTFTMKELQTIIHIKSIQLPDGIASVTLYDSIGKPHCERLIYVSHGIKRPSASLLVDTADFKANSIISATISAPPKSNFSMSVTNSDIEKLSHSDINSYLLLESEVKGTIESPERYFDTTNVNRYKQLDLLLLTQGWRDFLWRRLADTTLHIRYPAEKGISISGVIRNEISKKTLSDVNVSLFVSGALGSKIFTGKTNDAGQFFFENVVFYGKQKLVLTAIDKHGKKNGVFEIGEPVTFLVDSALIENQWKKSQISNYKTSILEDIQPKYAPKQPSVKDIIQLKEVKVKGPTDPTKEKTIILRDGNAYTEWGTNQTLVITNEDQSYKTLSWFLLQKGKNARQSNLSNYDGIVFLADGKLIVPFIIVNGKQMFGTDPSLFFNMPIEKFKSVTIKEVVLSSGSMPIFFILFLNMKEDYLLDNPGMLTTYSVGYDEARIFYQACSERLNARNNRSTIFWRPNLKTNTDGNAKVSFCTATNNKGFTIVIQGISEDGIPFSLSNYYSNYGKLLK